MCGKEAAGIVHECLVFGPGRHESQALMPLLFLGYEIQSELLTLSLFTCKMGMTPNTY